MGNGIVIESDGPISFEDIRIITNEEYPDRSNIPDVEPFDIFEADTGYSTSTSFKFKGGVLVNEETDAKLRLTQMGNGGMVPRGDTEQITYSNVEEFTW